MPCGLAVLIEKSIYLKLNCWLKTTSLVQTYIRCDRVLLPRYLGPNVLAIKNNVHFLWKHRALIAINFAQPSSNCEVVDKFVSLFNCVLSLFSHLSILFLSLFYTIHSLPIPILCVWMDVCTRFVPVAPTYIQAIW